MPFYENYVRLCNSIDKSPSAVAIELKLGKPSVSRWKSGTVPRDATVQKIADYFGVTTSYLRDEKEPEEQKEPPTTLANSEGLRSTDYDKLNEANRAIIDDLIAKLVKAQSEE